MGQFGHKFVAEGFGDGSKCFAIKNAATKGQWIAKHKICRANRGPPGASWGLWVSQEFVDPIVASRVSWDLLEPLGVMKPFGASSSLLWPSGFLEPPGTREATGNSGKLLEAPGPAWAFWELVGASWSLPRPTGAPFLGIPRPLGSSCGLPGLAGASWRSWSSLAS